ncbi:MAG: integral membrane sensor signal transduction histidine kinase [uncultured bacterium]|nr:MAG: integral membrane sensor signal transduction histidine kinase [uncultured bacterium]HBD05671.1 hypothetical protein [Candidatus Uhrbacteria bacterium]
MQTKSKTALVIAIAILAIIGAISFYFSIYTKARLTEQTVQKMSLVAKTASENVLALILRLETDTTKCTTDQYICAEIEALEAGEDGIRVDALNDYLKQKLQTTQQIFNIDIISLSGTVLASSNTERVGHTESLAELNMEYRFSDAAEAKYGQTFLSEIVSEVGEPGHDADKAFHISAPIISPITNKPIAVLVNHVFVDELNGALGNWQQAELGIPSESFEVYLVNKRKLMITESGLIKNAALRQTVDTEPVKGCVYNEQETTGEWKNYLGTKVVGAGKCLQQMVLIAEISEKEMLSSSQLYKLEKIAFYSAFVLAGALIALLLILLSISWKNRKQKELIAKPLKKLFVSTYLIAVCMVLALSFLIAFALSQVIKSSFIESRYELTLPHLSKLLEKHVSDPLFLQNWQQAQVRNDFENFANEIEDLPGIMRIKIHKVDGTVMWTDLPTEKVGYVENIDNLQKIKKIGEAIISELPKEEARTFGKSNVIAIHQPVYFGQIEPQAIVEAYFDAEPIYTEMRRIQIKTMIIAIGVMFILGGLIFLFSHKANKKYIFKLVQLVNERSSELLRVRQEYTAMLAHELRAPLTNIRWAVEGVLGSLNKKQSEERESLESVSNSAITMLSIVNNMLDLTKIEAGKFKIKPIKSDIAAVIKEKIAEFIPQANNKGLNLNFASDKKIVNFSFDPIRIGQVIINLLSNAIKFTNKGSVTVSIAKSSDGKRIHVAVSDTGSGIPADLMPKLFQKFVQLGKDDKSDKNRGTGLGLAIVKGIVEAHNGTVGVNSTVGKGSEFWFELPI